MNNLIEKINQILKERKLDSQIQVKDEADILRVIERLSSGNIQMSSEVKQSRKTIAFLSEKIKENDAKIIDEIEILRTDTRMMFDGKSPYQKDILATAKANGGKLFDLHDKILKVYRGLRNQFGKTAFWYDENNI